MSLSESDLKKLLGMKPGVPAPKPPKPKLGAGGAAITASALPAKLEELLDHSEDTEGGEDIAITKEGVEQAPIAPPSPNALVLDKWDVQRGIDCLEQSKALQAGFPDLNMNTLNEVRQRAEAATADMHGLAFLMDPQPVQSCTDPRRLEFVQQLLATPECQALRQSTVLNDLASEMAATQFGLQWVELVKADAEREAKAKTGKGKPNPERDELQKEMGLRRAVSKALDKAKEEVDGLDDVSRGLGGDGSEANNPQEAKKIAEAYRRISKNEALKEIFNRAGAFRRFMQSQQRKKVVHGTDDVVGVDLSGDVSRLLPVELGRIADEDLEMDTLRRLVEKQCISRLYRGVERVGKGPVVVCVDESGSMHGDPIWNAKAFALAMAMLAKKQNRWCTLVGFSGGTEGTWVTLPPGKWDQRLLMDWLEHFYSGGTELDIPIEKVPSMWKEWEKQGLQRGKTDFILVTDAICNVPPAMGAKFNSWKKENSVRCVSLVIAAHNENTTEIKKVSDEVHIVRGISTGEEGVAACLSL